MHQIIWQLLQYLYFLINTQFIYKIPQSPAMQLDRDDSVEIFKSFISQVNELNFHQLLIQAQRQYSVRQFKLGQLSPSTAQQIYQNICIKFRRHLEGKSELNWWENQLRIFVWTLVFYVHIHSSQIQSLVMIYFLRFAQTEDDWRFFSSIFPHKQLILFEYQSINILKEHGQAKKWALEEDQIFVKLVKYPIYLIDLSQKGLQCKWSELAKLLYINSKKKYFRTPKQCRQRWLNHLDPSKSKSEWSAREDFILIKYVYEKQKRWAEISKLLQNKRNEHSIKNRFKSLITKQIKFHKQKLTEKQLIESIYHRYRQHLGKMNSNNRNEKMEQMGQRQKVEEQGEKQVIRGLQKSSMFNLHQSNNNNHSHSHNHNNNSVLSIFPSIPHQHSQSPPMYPFTWYKKQQSFTPFRKSQQYFPFSQYSQPNNLKRNFITSSYNSSMMEELQDRKEWDRNDDDVKEKVVKGEDNNNYLMNGNNNNYSKNYGDYYSQQQQSPQRISNYKRYPLPAQHYQPQNHFYSQAFGSSSQLQLGSNYQQFLPIQEQRESIIQHHHHIIDSKEMFFSNFPIDKKGSIKDEMDQQERKVRAEIFLLDNPLDVVRGFFYKAHHADNKCVNEINVNVNYNGDSQQRINDDGQQI